MEKKYTIGIDYGSEYARLVLVDVSNGKELETLEIKYKCGDISNRFSYVNNSILHNPQDYLDVVFEGIPELVRTTEINPLDIIAIGIDSTTSTVLPTDIQGKPLCNYREYHNQPEAYINLWKNHMAIDEACKLNKRLEEIGLVERVQSPEWIVPKAAHIFNCNKNLYEKAYRIIEVSDWIVWILTGRERRSRSQAIFTSTWTPNNQCIPKEVLRCISNEFENLYSEKLADEYFYAYESAGHLKEEYVNSLALSSKVVVSVSNIDAVAAVPSMGVVIPGMMVSVIGTSSCHMVISDVGKNVQGAKKVLNGIFPNLYSYISSQVAVGDSFRWFIQNMIPYDYYMESKNRNISLFEFMSEKIQFMKPAQGKCISLDLWNGTRMDPDCRGNIYGVNIHSTCEEIFLSLVESTAFGFREIVENFEKEGIMINGIYAAGGIAHKNPVIMQIYANVVGKDIYISRSPNASAFGSAIYAAVAAGTERGGYSDLKSAAEKMGGVKQDVYNPNMKYKSDYDELYARYRKIKAFFLNK